MRKIVTGLLAGLMVLTLAACGRKGEEVKNSKEYVYRAEEIVIDAIEDMNTISTYSIYADRMLLVGYNWDDTGRTVYTVSCNPDGSDSSVKTMTLEENQAMASIKQDEHGNRYVIFEEYFEDDSDPDNYIWETNYYLIKMDEQGKELWRQKINDNNSEDFYGVNDLLLIEENQIILVDSAGIRVFDSSGSLVKKTKVEEDWSGGEIYKLRDGSLVANIYNSDTGKYTLRKLDSELNGFLPEEYTVPGMAVDYSYSYYAGVSHDLLLVDNIGVSGYNLGDEEATLLMNFIDSDLDASYINNIQAVSETQFYGIINENQTGNTVLMRFTKVAPEDVVDKTVLTLACNGVNWDVRNQVVKFNKTNTKYRIRINDYSQYNTDDDYTAGATKMNTDIASGNIPDMLILDSDFPVESYSSKGLFEDLYTYIDKDEELNRQDYFSNIFSALETEGKLYRLVPSFTVLTTAGKTADVGAEGGCTLKELNQILATKPEGTRAFAQETRSTVLSYSIQMSNQQFIDKDTGKCSFNSDGFIDLLEFLKQFPEEYDDEKYGDSYWQDYNSLWRQGKVLLRIFTLDSFDSYNYTKKGVFGTDITLIGFPSDNKEGSVIVPSLDIVMSSKSKNKDGAWEFMRFFLSDDYQNNIEYGWPLSMKRVEELAEKAKKKPFYEDEFGNIVEYDQTYYVDGVDIPISPMTDAEIEEVMNFIKSLEQVYTYDANLINIISEEAAPYFADQKNAKEVAEIIQSRIQIYVNENR